MQLDRAFTTVYGNERVSIEPQPGDTLTVKLPSGTVLTIDVTPDDADVSIGDRMIYSELRLDDVHPADWREAHPVDRTNEVDLHTIAHNRRFDRVTVKHHGANSVSNRGRYPVALWWHDGGEVRKQPTGLVAQWRAAYCAYLRQLSRD